MTYLIETTVRRDTIPKIEAVFNVVNAERVKPGVFRVRFECEANSPEWARKNADVLYYRKHREPTGPIFTPIVVEERKEKPKGYQPIPVNEDLFSPPDDIKTRARFDKAVQYLYRMNCVVLPLCKHLECMDIAYKQIGIRTRTKKKVQLEYKKLKNPKTEYTVWNSSGRGIDVPKLVYDALKVPEREPVTY